jgi:PAS domain S-box-containing protein
MEKKANEMQQLQTTYNIALAIGISTDMQQMLKNSVHAFLQHLPCSAGGVFQYAQEETGHYTFQPLYTVPRQIEEVAAFQTALAQLPERLEAKKLAAFYKRLPILGQSDNGQYYAILELPAFGLLLLIREEEQLTKQWLQRLRPLQDKLAVTCIDSLTERTLQAETHFQTNFNHIEDGYYEVDLQGSFTFFNKALTHVVGYPENELLGLNYRDYTDAENAQKTKEAFTQVYETGRSIKAFLWQTIRKDGRRQFMETSITLMRNEHGEAVGFRGITRDVTEIIHELQQKETAVRTTEEIYRSVLETLEDGYYEIDLRGHLTGMNSRLPDIVGYPPAEMDGLSFREYTDEETSARLFAAYNQIFTTGEPIQNMAYPIITKAKQERFIEVSASLMHNAVGEPIGFNGIVRDVTDRMHAEDALTEALVEQERMSAHLSMVAKVSTAVSTILDPTEMLQSVVDLIQRSFNLYHAHIYLLRGATLELAVGAGKIGRQMVEQKHLIPLAQEHSLVARAARTRQGVIANNVANTPDFLPNPLLPHTQAEMAIPMLIGNKLLGIIDLQAKETNSFNSQDISVHSTLATQVAVALQNARQYQQIQAQSAELKEEQKRTQTILDAITTPMLISSMESGKILYANDALAELLRTPLTELINAQAPNIYDNPQVRAEGMKTLQAEGLINNVELLLNDGQGQPRWVLLSARLLTFEGQPAIIASLADITERKQAEEQLQLQNTALNTAANGIAITNRDGEILWVNRAFFDLTQYDAAEAVGQNPRIMKSGKQDQAFYEQMWQTILRGEVWRGELINRRKDQSLYNEEMTITPVRASGGEVTHFITIKQDITARKQAELQIKRQAEIESLGRSLSAQFLDLPSAEIDHGIQDALVMLGQFTGVDRAYMFVFAEENGQEVMQYRAEWLAAGVDSTMAQYDLSRSDQFPFFMGYMHRQETFHLPRVASLPEDAEAERMLFSEAAMRSIICVPLNSQGKTVGFLGFDTVHEEKMWLPDEIGLLQLISGIVVSALNRQRSEQELTRALLDSERLYEMSASLNSTNSMAGMLAAVVQPVMEHGLMSANLMKVDVDSNGRPEWLEIAAAWPQDAPVNAAIPIGARFYLPEMPSARLWIDNPYDVGLYGDVENDPNLDEVTKGLYKMGGVKASANLPLRYGNQWIGLMVLSWSQVRTFTSQDARLYRSLAEQTAVALNSQLLLQKTQTQAQDLAAVAEIGAHIAGIRQSDILLQTIVDLVQDRFSLYHTQIYLLNENILYLASSTGEIGQQLMEEGHRVALTAPQSLIARAARSGVTVIVNQVLNMADFLPNPLLPATRAVMAIPVMVADEVLGVLDLQSDKEWGFQDEDARVQATLAAQIGIALQNVRTFARSEETLRELEEVTRRLRREGWESFLIEQERTDYAFSYDLQHLVTVAEQPTAGGNGHGRQQPLVVHGEMIGELLLEEPEIMPGDADVIMTAVAERLSAHMENLRLTAQTERALAQTEQQATRLARLNEISTEMGNAASLQEVYQIAVRRIPDMLPTDRVSLLVLQPRKSKLRLVAAQGVDVQVPVGQEVERDRQMQLAIQQNQITTGVAVQNLTYVRHIPIVAAAQVVAVLNIATVGTPYTPQEESLLRQMAAILGSLIENRQLLEAAQARAERERRVRTITDKVRRGSDRDAILHIAREELQRMLNASYSTAQLGTAEQIRATITPKKEEK